MLQFFFVAFNRQTLRQIAEIVGLGKSSEFFNLFSFVNFIKKNVRLP